MKNFDSRAYSINDFLEWNDKKQLQLSPKFQRKAVWSDDAKSYLMDTIIRGKPIPKIFIRQTINVENRQSIREVVDGQQRLRTILSYINDGFIISKKHNEKYGGYYFSQLSNVDPDIQSVILNYEISVDLLVNLPDREILDIFSRLNSYSVVLNEQEKINANHFSEFKILVDKLSHKHNDFWLENKLLTHQNILRMADVTLVSDLVISMCEGIQSKKQIKAYYLKYEKSFDFDSESIEKSFDETIELLKTIFNEGLKNTPFKRIHLFYTIFTSLYHTKYGLKNFSKVRIQIPENKFERAKLNLTNLNILFDTIPFQNMSVEQIQFLEDSRRATTDTKVRIRRSEFIIDIINSL
ncbi:DUF262 domain-containing protein [Flavobacterium sp. FPG59]|jgi:hypothetical protein|uniref:DUF262 domain-containing protein n=1 Tax=Flavobacterium sp. FPG59 TaxID=1929267 RepID=UPI000A3B921B|nr:DUF262 domain-containing protein [Flavobacterium sp. FPG59]OUD34892.1 hypothetical protein FPG59_12035 [Flavobacterium sp. FPG59]